MIVIETSLWYKHTAFIIYCAAYSVKGDENYWYSCGMIGSGPKRSIISLSLRPK